VRRLHSVVGGTPVNFGGGGAGGQKKFIRFLKKFRSILKIF